MYNNPNRKLTFGRLQSSAPRLSSFNQSGTNFLSLRKSSSTGIQYKDNTTSIMTSNNEISNTNIIGGTNDAQNELMKSVSSKKNSQYGGLSNFFKRNRPVNSF